MVQDEIRSPAKRAGMKKFPDGCPFDPQVDLWEPHEFAKKSVGTHGKHVGKDGRQSDSSAWTCGFCGKQFKSEYYLDLHMERRHMNETPTHNPVCLADYCEMFEVCDGLKREHRTGQKGRAKPGRKKWECNNETIARSKRFCENALHRCFPIGEDETRLLHAQLSRHHCQTLDCRVREEKKKDHNMVPIVVVLILVLFAGAMIFGVSLCLVDYSDDIIAWLADSRFFAPACIKKFVQARMQVREKAGYQRVKGI